MTVPVYLAEAAPASIRGRLLVLNNMFITGSPHAPLLMLGGQCIAGIVDGAFSEVPDGWRCVHRHGNYLV